EVCGPEFRDSRNRDLAVGGSSTYRRTVSSTTRTTHFPWLVWECGAGYWITLCVADVIDFAGIDAELPAPSQVEQRSYQGSSVRFPASNLGKPPTAVGRDVELVASKTGRSGCAGSKGGCRR
ncbi:MAG: hypothetical protein ABI433_18720, partial [Burkholderiaceae bacterium]